MFATETDKKKKSSAGIGEKNLPDDGITQSQGHEHLYQNSQQSIHKSQREFTQNHKCRVKIHGIAGEKKQGIVKVIRIHHLGQKKSTHL